MKYLSIICVVVLALMLAGTGFAAESYTLKANSAVSVNGSQVLFGSGFQAQGVTVGEASYAGVAVTTGADGGIVTTATATGSKIGGSYTRGFGFSILGSSFSGSASAKGKLTK